MKLLFVFYLNVVSAGEFALLLVLGHRTARVLLDDGLRSIPFDLGVVVVEQVGEAVVVFSWAPLYFESGSGVAECEIVEQLHGDVGRAEGRVEYIVDWLIIILMHQIDFPESLKDCPEIVGVEIAGVILQGDAFNFEYGIELV